MSNSSCPTGALIVVATGAQAKFFSNDGTSEDIKLSYIGELSPKSLDGDGPSGKRPPESSERETDEATFAKQIANHLYGKSHRGEFEQLVLIADPDTLGEIRPILHQEVSEKISAELNKTLINSSTGDIERSLAAAK